MGMKWAVLGNFCQLRESLSHSAEPHSNRHARIQSQSYPFHMRCPPPQVDPAVIASVSCGPWVLLGRKAAWKQGRYSCLAGFTEMGEALEDAVVR